MAGVLIIVVAVFVALSIFKGVEESSLVAVGLAPGSALSVVAKGAVSATAPTYSWIPKDHILSDAAFLSQGTYVLLIDPKTISSNVYKKEGQSLKQVTFTNTMKYSLAGDSKTGLLAFMSAHLSKESDIFSLQQADVMIVVDGKERFLGTGTDIIGFAGDELGIQRPDGLFAISVAEGSLGSTRKVGERSLAATDGKQLAHFNSVTKAVDIFDVTNGFTGMSYVKSLAVDFTPTVLGFSSGVAVALAPSPSSTSFLLSSLNGSATRVITKSNPNLPGVPFKFIQNKL